MSDGKPINPDDVKIPKCPVKRKTAKVLRANVLGYSYFTPTGNVAFVSKRNKRNYSRTTKVDDKKVVNIKGK